MTHKSTTHKSSWTYLAMAIHIYLHLLLETYLPTYHCLQDLPTIAIHCLHTTTRLPTYINFQHLSIHAIHKESLASLQKENMEKLRSKTEYSIPSGNLGKVPLCAQSVQHSNFRGGHFTLNMPFICGLELLTMTFA